MQSTTTRWWIAAFVVMTFAFATQVAINRRLKQDARESEAYTVTVSEQLTECQARLLGPIR